MNDDNCIFCRIARGELPSNTVYEDDDMLAFHDIHPVAPVHFMVIPKLHIASFADVKPEHAGVLGRIMSKIPAMASAQGLTDGWRTIITNARFPIKQEACNCQLVSRSRSSLHSATGSGRASRSIRTLASL